MKAYRCAEPGYGHGKGERPATRRPLSSVVPSHRYYVIGTVVVKRSSPVAALKTLTVASSPTTGFRPGGQSAAAVVTSKSTRPCSGVIGSVVAWRWPPGWFEPDRVSQARATSTRMMTAPVPRPAMAPAHSTAGPSSVATTVQMMGLLGTSCGFTAKALDGTTNAAAATAQSTSKSRFILLSVLTYPHTRLTWGPRRCPAKPQAYEVCVCE